MHGGSLEISLTVPLIHFLTVGKPVDCGAYLLEQGGDLNARTEWGDTPIHYAALRGSGEILR